MLVLHFCQLNTGRAWLSKVGTNSYGLTKDLLEATVLNKQPLHHQVDMCQARYVLAFYLVKGSQQVSPIVAHDLVLL